MSGHPFDARGFDAQGEARDALRTAVSSYGSRVLSDPRILGNLVADLLPDSPRERSLLVTAAEAGVSAELTQHVQQQRLDVDTAVSIVARGLTERRSIDIAASTWVAAEFARALGYQVRSVPPPAQADDDTAMTDTVRRPRASSPAPPFPVPGQVPAAGRPPQSPVTPPLPYQPQSPYQGAAYQGAAAQPSAKPGGYQQPGQPAGYQQSGQPAGYQPAAYQPPSAQPGGQPGAPYAPTAYVPVPPRPGAAPPQAGQPLGGQPPGGQPPGQAGYGYQPTGYQPQAPAQPSPGQPQPYQPAGFPAQPAYSSPYQPQSAPGTPQPPGWGGSTTPAGPGRGPRRGLLYGGIGGGVVVIGAIVGVLLATSSHGPPPAPTPSVTVTHTTPPKPKPTPTVQASPTIGASITPVSQLLPGDITDTTTECQNQSLPLPFTAPGLVTAIKCTDPGLPGGEIFSFQSDSAADYQTTWKNYNNWLGFNPGSAGTSCPPSGSTPQGITEWKPKSESSYKQGQVLECGTLGNGSSTQVVYIWSFPDQDAFIVAQGSHTTTFSAIDTWWKAEA